MADTPVASRLTVGTSATLIDAEGANYWDGVIVNRSVNPIYVGPSSVTTSTGLQLDAGQAMDLRVAGTARGWYAIAASAGNRVDRAAIAG